MKICRNCNLYSYVCVYGWWHARKRASGSLATGEEMHTRIVHTEYLHWVLEERLFNKSPHECPVFEIQNLEWIQSRLCRNFMDITPYGVVCPYERFEGNCCLHLQGKKFTSRTITSYFLYLFNFKQQVGDLIQSML